MYRPPRSGGCCDSQPLAAHPDGRRTRDGCYSSKGAPEGCRARIDGVCGSSSRSRERRRTGTHFRCLRDIPEPPAGMRPASGRASACSPRTLPAWPRMAAGYPALHASCLQMPCSGGSSRRAGPRLPGRSGHGYSGARSRTADVVFRSGRARSSDRAVEAGRSDCFYGVALHTEHGPSFRNVH